MVPQAGAGQHFDQETAIIQIPKSSDLRKRSSLITKDDIDAEIRRLKKLKEDSEREAEWWLRDSESARGAEECEET